MKTTCKKCGAISPAEAPTCHNCGERLAEGPSNATDCSRCFRLALRIAHLAEALEAADECLALIEDVGHGAHMDNVTVARGLITKAMSFDPANASVDAPAHD